MVKKTAKSLNIVDSKIQSILLVNFQLSSIQDKLALINLEPLTTLHVKVLSHSQNNGQHFTKPTL